METQVIGFLTYTDFLEEIRKRVSIETIRVQGYFSSNPDSSYSGVIQHYTFTVESAVSICTPDGKQKEVLLCRFITAKTTATGDHDREKIKTLNERNRAAAAILEADLKNFGFNVGHGIIAAVEESKTEADPGALLVKLEIDNQAEKD